MTELIVKRVELTVEWLTRSMGNFQLDPSYQRDGGIWTKERQQLFIDSILNGFDVPPIYLHLLQPPEFSDGRSATYAVVDGRQRLETITRFFENDLSLANDFRLLEEDAGIKPALSEELEPGPSRYAGLRFEELRRVNPALAYRFMDRTLAVTTVETSNLDLIEELFFRLNEGVPLTAAEKRARGVLLRELVHPLVHEEDLFRCARFQGKRRTYEDLLIRLLYLEQAQASLERIPDLKKRQLDEFSASFRPTGGSSWSSDERDDARLRLEALVIQVRPVFDSMNNVFEESDSLLNTVTGFMVHYLVVRALLAGDERVPSRTAFALFAEKVAALKGQSEEDLTNDQLDALEYAQPIQGSTTGSYFLRRAQILFGYLQGTLQLP